VGLGRWNAVSIGGIDDAPWRPHHGIEDGAMNEQSSHIFRAASRA
jgi:hypothetical protein